MEVVIRQHEQQCGVTAADIFADAVVSGATTLGLATGSSPISVYRELIRRHRQTGLSFAAVQAFLLDEYVGLPPSHPQSYAHVIRAEFTDHVDIDSDRVHSPNGVADTSLLRQRSTTP
jgi:glucosamine-6-phosphate deaminase